MSQEGDLPESGDLSSDANLSDASLSIGAGELKSHRDEIEQTIRHREAFFRWTMGISVVLLLALLAFIFCGHGDAVTATVAAADPSAKGAPAPRPVTLVSKPSHVRLTELIILALLPSALLLKLGTMVSHRRGDEKRSKELDVPLASVTVAQEALKNMAEIAKSFRH